MSKRDPLELTVSPTECTGGNGGSAHRTRGAGQAPGLFLVESSGTGNTLLILGVASFGTLHWRETQGRSGQGQTLASQLRPHSTQGLHVKSPRQRETSFMEQMCIEDRRVLGSESPG